MITRRDFLKYTGMAFVSTMLTYSTPLYAGETDEDKRIFQEKIKLAEEEDFFSLPINEVVIDIGKSFINTPYVADTLDLSGNEALVTNLHGLDCWTFFENSLVIARVIKKKSLTFENYKKELEFVRYRGGIRNGYSSRLHYIIDWIYDNREKGVVADINKDLGGIKLNKIIDFMTSHRDLYPPLDSRECFEKLKSIEEKISSRDNYYVPTDILADTECELKSGDIFGLISDTKGLDAFHTGLIYKENGNAFILDAASSVGYVDIYRKSVYEYLSEKKLPGIVLARPLSV